MCADQNWEPVVLRKNQANVNKVAKSNAELNQALRKGEVEVIRKADHKGVPANARKLEAEDADFHLPQISHDFKVALMKARQAKSLTQAELAQRMNVKPTVINDYEAGKAIPDPHIVSTLQRILDCQLPKIQKPKKAADAM